MSMTSPFVAVDEECRGALADRSQRIAALANRLATCHLLKRVQFKILGPLAAEHDGVELPLGTRKQRAVLAILLLRANEVVSRDLLIDELWGERLPETAEHTLQAYVSRLRKTFRAAADGEQLIVTQPPGYLLRVGVDQLDLHRFERLAGEGRRALATGAPERAAAKLREALSVWRGPALADLAFEPFARIDVERLEEQRLAALEDRIDADLAVGRNSLLVPELERLVTEHPLRERLRAQLMLALYRCGRQANALRVYREAREYLVDEFGLDPSPALQQLERAILSHDPSLAVRGSEVGGVAAKLVAAPPHPPVTPPTTSTCGRRL